MVSEQPYTVWLYFAERLGGVCDGGETGWFSADTGRYTGAEDVYVDGSRGEEDEAS